MKPTNKLPTPSEAGLPDNVLREANQAVASSLQPDDEGRRGTGVIKFWGPRENGDPGSPFSRENGDPSGKMGTPAHSVLRTT